VEVEGGKLDRKTCGLQAKKNGNNERRLAKWTTKMRGGEEENRVFCCSWEEFGNGFW